MSNKITITDNTTKVVTIAAQGPKGDKGAFSPDENQTINFSGSKYSGSMLISMTTTGSIIPEGAGSWDLGSPSHPFRDLYITTASIKFETFLTRKHKWLNIDANELPEAQNSGNQRSR